MSLTSSSLDWKESPGHLDLLGHFVKARDVQQVMGWQYLRETLKENPAKAIDRFIRDGMLIPATTEDSLEVLFPVAQLKQMLQERSLRVSGSKKELIQRLVDADRAGMEQVTTKSKVMECSPAAVEVISQFEKRKEQAYEEAMRDSFDAFMDNDPKRAYRSYVTFQRTFRTPELFSDPSTVETLQWILESRPEALLDVTPQDLATLRVAACMQTLWRREYTPESWLPSDLQVGFIDNRVAINYLLINAQIKEEVAQIKGYVQQAKLVFHAGDIDSCDRCRSLDGKLIDIEAVPELPLLGCTSRTGCQCHIEGVYSCEEGLDDEDLEDTSDEDLLVEIGPVETLRLLKQMLDESLITQNEHDTKKAEILARL